jgi:hypothetical protein
MGKNFGESIEQQYFQPERGGSYHHVGYFFPFIPMVPRKSNLGHRTRSRFLTLPGISLQCLVVRVISFDGYVVALQRIRILIIRAFAQLRTPQNF